MRVAIMDTDGDCTKLIPWIQSVGVEGVLPLERQAKVDGMVLREAYPTLRMIGHYNKLVMHLGEAAMRAEFERLAPLIRRVGSFPVSITRRRLRFQWRTTGCFCGCWMSTRWSSL